MGVGIGNALGGLFGGAVEGYKTGIKMQQDAEKAKREQEMHESTIKTQDQQRQATGLQIENSRMDLDRKKKEEAMHTEIAQNLSKLQNLAQGGMTGEVQDAQGNVVGAQTFYGDDASIQKQMADKGLRFSQGSVQKVPAMDQWDYSRSVMDTIKMASIKHGMVDEDKLMKSLENSEKLKKMGVESAFKTFAQTGDSAAALSQFEKASGHKLPPGAQMSAQKDPDFPMIPNYVVYAPNEKTGKLEYVTSSHDYLAATNSEALSHFILNSGLEKYKQGKETQRTGMKVEGELGSATIRGQYDLAAADRRHAAEKENPQDKQIDTLVYGTGGHALGAPNYGYSPSDTIHYMDKTAARAKQILREGIKGKAVPDVYTALDIARSELKNETPEAKVRK